MNKKGIAPLLIVLIVVSVLAVGGTSVYVAKNPQIIDKITGKAVVEQKAQELENKSKELEIKAQELEKKTEEQQKLLEEQQRTAEEKAKELETQNKQLENQTKQLASQIQELSKPVCKDVQVPYEEQESYTEQEPYVKTEYYNETVPYVEKVCETKNLIYTREMGSCIQKVEHTFSDDEPAKMSCTFTNLDTSTGGTFSIKIGFNVGGQEFTETQGYYIYPQSSHLFYTEKDVTITGSCYCYEAGIPTKQVCNDVTKYKEVQKSREITAYNTVTKYRTVTKFKTENVCD